jgi:hypothetical protein
MINHSLVTFENLMIHDFHHLHDEILILEISDEICHDSLDEIEEKIGEGEKDEGCEVMS